MREGKKAARACLDCGAMYAVSSPRQQRCATCRAKHDRIKNKQYQAEHRRRRRETESKARRRAGILRALELPQHETNYPKREVIRAYTPPSEPQKIPSEPELTVRYVPVGRPNRDETVSPLFHGLFFRW